MSRTSFLTNANFARLIALVFLAALCVPHANAVPSYSRQTGLACSSCHYTPPELTPFGRKFKLEGYTFATKPTIKEDKKDNAGLNLLESLPLSFVFDTSFTSTKAPQPSTQNGNFEFPQAVSLFLAGQWASHVGSFVQVTYDAQGDHFSWDNTDIRAAGTNGKLFGKQLTYGLTLNNNPTVEDLWNSTPAWGFPFVSTDVAPGPTAGALINGGLGQDVAGVGGYAMWNDHLYLVGTVYRSEHIGGSQPNDGTCCGINIRGMAPYWRLAYQTTSENNDFEIGTYGMHLKSTNSGITGPEDSFTDWAADFQYNRTIPRWNNHVFTLRATYIRENSALHSTPALFPYHHLNTIQGEAEYHWGTKVSTTAGLFSVTGTSDPLLYPQGAVSGNLNGNPDSKGYIFNLSYWPQQNIGLTAQYTGYTRFNGGSSNYDQAGRNANGNNSIYLMARFVF
ncbi:MAG TPA: hypothetical protein VF133_04595 [Terriglobales bacterium]